MSKCYLNSKEWSCFLEGQNCQEKNKNWTCIQELKCLLVFKQVEAGEVLNSLCKELAKDKDFRDIGKDGKSIEESRISSIIQKIYNIHFLSEKEIKGLSYRSNASETTKKIFKKCKNWSVEQLKQEIIKLEKR